MSKYPAHAINISQHSRKWEHFSSKVKNFFSLNEFVLEEIWMVWKGSCGIPSTTWGNVQVQVHVNQTQTVRRCRDGAVVIDESTHLPLMWPRFDFQIWLSNVGYVCWFSTLHREAFSGNSGFLSPQKPTFDLVVLIVNFCCSVLN